MKLKKEINRIQELMGIRIRQIKDSDIPVIFENLHDTYDKLNLSNKTIMKMIGNYDKDLSVVLEINGEIGGFYFFKKNNIPKTDKKEYDELKDLKGIEGVALGVFKKFRNKGYGKLLINYPKKLGYDYIWGYQLKDLENLNDWLKRRKLYFDGGGLYVTYQIF